MTGSTRGKLNLWTYDAYHASTHGYYLEALVIFGTITRRDPRSLGENECSAFELGLSRPETKALQQIALTNWCTGVRRTCPGRVGQTWGTRAVHGRTMNRDRGRTLERPEPLR